MTQKFARYSPDVEQIESDFEQTLQQVLELSIWRRWVVSRTSWIAIRSAR